MKGTHFLADINQWDLTVSANNPLIGTTPAAIEAANEVFTERLGKHNAQLATLFRSLAFWTDRDTLAFGGSDRTRMSKVDEPGRAKPSKAGNAYTIGLPLEKFQYGWQGTYDFFRDATVRHVAKNQLLMMDADATELSNGIMRALFRATNYDFTDELTSNDLPVTYTLKVKALANGDGLPLPPGPNGEVFNAGTHTHYTATTDYTAAGLLALIATVREHTLNSVPEVWIPAGLETLTRALTGFYRYEVPRLVVAENTTRIVSPTLDMGNVGDRAIGEFDGCVVWVKPQMPSGYVLCYETNTAMKPVAIRYNPKRGLGLYDWAEDDVPPLRAKTFERQFGCGIWNRVGAAIWKPNNGDTTYVAPTFA